MNYILPYKRKKPESFRLTESGKKELSGIRWILNMLAVYTVLAAEFAAYLSVFEYEISLPKICGILIPVTAAAGILFRKRGGRWKTPGTVAGLGILAFVGRKQLFCGLIPFINRYIEARNYFYGIEQAGIEGTFSLPDVVAALVMIQLILASVLIMVLRSQRFCVTAFLILLLPVIEAATTGQMPSMAAGWGLLAAGGLYLIVYHQRDDRLPGREICGMAVILGILYGCTVLILPKVEAYKEANRETYDAVKNTLIDSQQLDIGRMIAESQKSRGNYSESGIGEGNLRNLAENRAKGTREMEVILSDRPESSLYLRAYTGTTYTGEKWKELGGFQFARLLPAASEKTKRELFEEPFRRIEEGQSSLAKMHAEIRIQNASRSYAYTPYFAVIPEGERVRMDAYVEGRRKKEWNYDFYPAYEAENEDPDRLSPKSELWDKYCRFVQETYLEYPEEITAIQNYQGVYMPGSKEELGELIDKSFESNLRYSLTPGAKPANQDFVEYFLSENRQGFCVHFATAATLIYRAFGYPARYVEGYVVSPSEFKWQKDGTYRAIVTDRAAHAWCEVFDEELGWQVKEHTLPYRDGDFYEEQGGTSEPDSNETDGTNQTPDSFTDPDTPQTLQTTPEDSQNTQAVSPTGGAEEGTDKQAGENGTPAPDGGSLSDNRVLGSLISAAATLSLIGLILVIQKRIRCRRKYFRFRIKKTNRGIAELYNEMYEICIFMGMEKKNESDRELAQRMKTEFPQLTEEEWDWAYQCAVRGAFTEEHIGRDEWKRLYYLYQKLRTAAMREMGRMKRFRFLYIRAL